jgi:hypothetical protein
MSLDKPDPFTSGNLKTINVKRNGLTESSQTITPRPSNPNSRIELTQPKTNQLAFDSNGANKPVMSPKYTSQIKSPNLSHKLTTQRSSDNVNPHITVLDGSPSHFKHREDAL